MKTPRLILATLATGILITFQPAPAADEPASKGNPKKVTYAADVKSILDHGCAGCHNAKKPKAGLQMDSLEGILKGTKKRHLVEPGKSADSHLIKLVESVAAAKDPNNKTKALHKKGVKPLTPEQIGLLKTWIDQGAK